MGKIILIKVDIKIELEFRKWIEAFIMQMIALAIVSLLISRDNTRIADTIVSAIVE